MLEAIRRAISFLRQKQVLHKLGVVISIAVIGIACYVLYHMLRGIDSNEVIEAIKGTEPRQMICNRRADRSRRASDDGELIGPQIVVAHQTTPRVPRAPD